VANRIFLLIACLLAAAAISYATRPRQNLFAPPEWPIELALPDTGRVRVPSAEDDLQGDDFWWDGTPRSTTAARIYSIDGEHRLAPLSGTEAEVWQEMAAHYARVQSTDERLISSRNLSAHYAGQPWIRIDCIKLEPGKTQALM
jgi:hypothetical protein